MQVNNKWNIGDALYLKQDILGWDKAEDLKELRYSLRPTSKPKARVVVALKAEQCTGGVQIFYALRGYTQNGTGLEYYNEVECVDQLE